MSEHQRPHFDQQTHQVLQYLQSLQERFPERNSLYKPNVFEQDEAQNTARQEEMKDELAQFERVFGISFSQILHDKNFIHFGAGFASSAVLLDFGADVSRMHVVDREQRVLDYHEIHFQVKDTNLHALSADDVIKAPKGLTELGMKDISLMIGIDLPAELIIAATDLIRKRSAIFSDSVHAYFTSTQPVPPFAMWNESDMVKEYLKQFISDKIPGISVSIKRIKQAFDDQEMLIEETYGYMIEIQ